VLELGFVGFAEVDLGGGGGVGMGVTREEKKVMGKKVGTLHGEGRCDASDLKVRWLVLDVDDVWGLTHVEVREER